MKKYFLAAVLGTVTLASLTGCVAAIGNQPAARSSATIGQQLIDLQKAKDAGVITDAEFQQQRARLLR